MKNTNQLIEDVRAWGRAKGIIGENSSGSERGQLAKLVEEANELSDAIFTNDHYQKIDAIGDCAVVLILLADIIDMRFEDCLDAAYQVIKQRTGRMVDGQFIKDN